MYILGIETSCDETAAAVVKIQNKKTEILSNIISSQIELHKKYGGVIPEVAAREHVLNILPVIQESLDKAFGKEKNNWEKISAIAVTQGPGLITSLLTGVETAKSLSFAWQKPLISVNHIEGHILSGLIKQNNVKLPAIILTVSGGHTNLILMKKIGQYKIIGETRDDAAGEAFDKAAKMMNLGYPGGPIISQLATKADFKKEAINSLPRPMLNSQNFDFSFSGLKTALLYSLKADKNWKNKKELYAKEFENAVVEVLTKKTIKACQKYKIKTAMLAGGVSANKKLRNNFKKEIKKINPKIEIIIPDLKYTTDNAVMIAYAGYYKFIKKDFSSWQKLKADSNLKL